MPKLKREVSVIDDISVLIKVIRIIKENKIDIIHCHSSKAGLIGSLAAWLMRVPVRVFTVHGWSSYGNTRRLAKSLYNILEKLTAGISTHITCVSEADREYALKYRLASQRKLYTIHNGSLPVEAEPYLRNELHIEHNKTIIGTVARLSPQKNPLFTIDVYAKLLIDDSNLLFVWVGDGPLMNECMERIKKVGIEDKFILLGNRDDANNLVGDFDIFSLLSEWESLPISIIEAMVLGVPVIASDVGGVGELIQDGKNGVLVGNKDIAEIRNKIINLIKNSELRYHYGKYSKIIAKKKFNQDKMIDKYKKIYTNG